MFIEPAVTAIRTTPANASLNRMVFDSSGTSISALPFYGVGNRDGGCLCQSLPTQDFGVNADDEITSGYRRFTGFGRASASR